MAKKKIKDIVEEMLSGFLADHELELFNLEYVKEGKARILRVYIDKPLAEDGAEQYVSIDECELVSRYLSDRLDEEDAIEENYTLEVSSPGIDRPLLKEQDFVRYAGRPVDVRLYKPLDGKKQFSADLTGLRDGIVLLRDEEGNDLEIPRDAISKISLAVIF